MRRRVGRPGLIGTMARTAVISGTATAVSGNVARRQQGKAQAQQQQVQEAQYGEIQQDQALQESQAQIASMQAQLNAQQQAAAAPAAGGGDDLMSQLKELAALKNAGILSDAEFAAAKAKLLSA
ncbi:SHOCT domain-containing protein [Demequina aurantiaca]|uniref:SHOCT domain-containing protein n=1 Tax=Demequina aurantiaca TaxID=676200 RepID=UPI00078418A4|nr:SHOCT domain-containing protein [Demequina aurantiaca]